MLYSAKSWAALCSFYALKDTECKMMTIIKGTGVCTQCSFQEQRTSGSPSLLSRPSGGKFLEGREAAVVGFDPLGSVCVGWTSHKQRVLIVLQEWLNAPSNYCMVSSMLESVVVASRTLLPILYRSLCFQLPALEHFMHITL